MTLQMAHGNIKHYQIWITVFGCLPFPLTWLAFKLGASSIVAYYIFVIVFPQQVQLIHVADQLRLAVCGDIDLLRL